ncbi:Structural maintenance of chromosomes protein 5 [Conglomerata obtusa]
MPKPGTLLKLNLTNFQTFKNASFNFSPHLNFIAAPNGSGKSTLTNAISFLCLGTPSTLCKQVNVKDFIKFGSTCATIEGVFLSGNINCNDNDVDIDTKLSNVAERTFKRENTSNYNTTSLLRDNILCDTQTTTIKRTITANESIFYINDQKVKKSDVKDLLNRWSIDVTNMTQFLPQDRVSEFSKMSNEELLKQVIRSSGVVLKEDELCNLEESIKQKSETLSNYTLKKKGTSDVVKTLKEDADRANEAISKQRRMKLIKYKMMSLEYNEAVKEVRKLSAKRRDDIKSISEYKEMIKLIDEEINKIKKNEDHIIFKNFIEENKNLQNFENTIDNLIKEREMLKIDLNSIEKRKEKRKSEIVEIKERKEEMVKRLKEIKEIDCEEENKKLKEKLSVLLKSFNYKFTIYSNDKMNVNLKKHEIDDYEEFINTGDDLSDEKIKRKKINIEKKFSSNSKFEQELQNFCYIENIKIDENVFENALNKLIEIKIKEKTKFKEEVRGIREDAANMKSQFEHLEKQKLNITEIEKKKLEMFRKINKDAFEAVLWLRENKNIFSNEVLEPSFLHIKIKNENYIDELETLLPRNALNSFVCTTSDDFELFTKKIKDEKKLNVNVILHENSIENNDYEKEKNINKLRELIYSLGFEYLCIDLIEARKEYLDIFCNLGFLNKIPITKKNLDETQLFKKYDFKKIIVNKKYIEKRVSRYSKDDFTMINSDCKRKLVFDTTNNENDILQIENGMKEINKRRELKIEEMKELLVKLENIEKEINKVYALKEEFDVQNKEIIEYGNLKVKLKKNIEYYIKMIDNLNNDVEYNNEKTIINNNITKVSKAMQNTIEQFKPYFNSEEFYKNYKKMYEIYQETENIENELLRLSREKQEPMMSISMLQENIVAVEKDLEILKKKRNICKNLLKEQKKSIEEIENEGLIPFTKLNSNKDQIDNKKYESTCQDKKHIENNEKSSEASEVRHNDFQLSYIQEMKQLPDDIPSLRQEYSNEKVSLAMYSVDLKSIEMYKIKNKSLNEINGEIEKIQTAILQFEKKLKKIRHENIMKVNYLLEPVNKRFSHFFEKMKCEGKVEFVHEGLEYNKWKLNIFVKFREDEPLMQLSSGRQSGGEKSVSTMIFLLALQNLSVSPFKLVDEINQGMDRNNEKMISNLLVKISEEIDAPQFFIITPKIVSGINFGENMKIIVIYGCEGETQEKFNNYKRLLLS